MLRQAIPAQLNQQRIDKLRDFLSIEHSFFVDPIYNTQFIDLLTLYAQNGSLSLFERLSLAALINKLPQKWQNELDALLITESPYSDLMFHMEQSKHKINKITVSTPQIRKSTIGLFRTPKSTLVTQTEEKKETNPQTPSPWFFQRIWRSDWLDIKTYKIVKLMG